MIDDYNKKSTVICENLTNYCTFIYKYVKL